MLRRISAFTVLLVLTVGCSPYPRYRQDPVITPEASQQTSEHLSTTQYIRFGLILQSYLGKPYSGTSRWERGVDCSAFVQEVFRKFNSTVLPRTVEDQYKLGRDVPRNRVKFGDLVFFRTERYRVSHVGVCLGYNEFIHASSSRGVIISNLSEEYWARRFVGVRRVLDQTTP